MYHTVIVEAVLDSPDDYIAGVNGVVLDDAHTMVLASDHEDATPKVTKDRLDEFVSGYETVNSHPEAGSVGSEIRRRDGGLIDSSD